MPVEVRQRLTGILEKMTCGRIDRETDLLVGAHRSAAFDLHRHLQIALGLDVQESEAPEPLHERDRGGDRAGGFDAQAFRTNPQRDGIAGRALPASTGTDRRCPESPRGNYCFACFSV